jgi:TM2 domain-containing membrane protein YozV
MKDKTTAILMCFLLGGIGGHKFYLGQTGMGLLYFFFCWTFIPAFVAFVELILLIVMDTNTFNMRFNQFAMAGAGGQMAQSQNIVVNVPDSSTGGNVNVTDQLQKLNDLRVQGVLSDQEFAEQKTRLLSAAN